MLCSTVSPPVWMGSPEWITRDGDLLFRHRMKFLIWWLCGIAVGVFSAHWAETFLFSLMLRIGFEPVSIVLFATACLSLLFAASAVLFSKQEWIYVVSFLVSLVFSLVGQTLRLCAGWLVQAVAYGCMYPVMAVYCWFCLTANRVDFVLQGGVSLSIWAIFAVIQRTCVVPYIEILLENW